MSLDLITYLEEKRRLVDQALEEALPQVDGPSQNLVRSMRYSLLAGGKRLRPVLCLAGCEAVGGRSEEALPAAAALELIHTYSLIHDDLPGMDDDDLRRGRPSNHMVFGEGLAILAGDGLLTLAFGLLARAGREGRTTPDRTLAALDVIARASGHEGMVAGQSADLEAEGLAPDEKLVEFIHTRKTGALIAAAVVAGAILGGGGPEQLAALEAYGRRLGLAFQITDDLLDLDGDPAETGKPVGSDQARGKMTYPLVLGLARAGKEADRLLDEAASSLAGFGARADPLRALAEYLKRRKK
ncbi:MAG: polyprenyl synthetase family protein [Thermodesulfobacteriota bacterium]